MSAKKESGYGAGGKNSYPKLANHLQTDTRVTKFLDTAMRGGLEKKGNNLQVRHFHIYNLMPCFINYKSINLQSQYNFNKMLRKSLKMVRSFDDTRITCLKIIIKT